VVLGKKITNAMIINTKKTGKYFPASPSRVYCLAHFRNKKHF